MRNQLAALFNAMGLQNTRAGTRESPAVAPAQATTQMNLVLQSLANPRAVPGIHPQAVLKHLWVHRPRVGGKYDSRHALHYQRNH